MRRGPLAFLVPTLVGAALALSVAPARASFDPTDPPAGEHTQTDGPRYWVGRVLVGYANEHPLQPPIDLVRDAPYALGRASDGYVGAPRRQQRVVPASSSAARTPCPLRDRPAGPVRAGGRGAGRARADRRLRPPPPNEIDPTRARPPARGEHRPPPGRAHRPGPGRAHFGARGGRGGAASAGDQQRPRGDRRALSAAAGGRGRPLNKNQLDAYLAGLNRLPGRMVDAVVTPTLTPGVVNLDYMVAEDRP